jgi:hypothetical protein
MATNLTLEEGVWLCGQLEWVSVRPGREPHVLLRWRERGNGASRNCPSQDAPDHTEWIST